MEDTKNLVRAANNVRGALMGLRNGCYVELLGQLMKFADMLKDVTFESNRLQAALLHNWLFAADYCRDSISRLLYDMQDSLTRMQKLADEPPREVPALSLLAEELKQLQQEFDKVDFDKSDDGHTISVTTAPIRLEGIYLGPFRIQLELNRLDAVYRDSPFRCIALDPRPASANGDVTHPHISGEKLCEGEGSAAIRASLEQGRLCDFFTMVRSILNTYSPDSPFVSLDDWDGVSCYECGYVTDRENIYYCSFCDHDHCEECSGCCYSCNEGVCRGCSESCPHCDERVCPNCIGDCDECGSRCCRSCSEDGICPTCREELEVKNEEQEEPVTGTNKNANPASPETNKPGIRLAG